MAMQMRRGRRLAIPGYKRGEIKSPHLDSGARIALTPGNHGAIRRASYGRYFAGKRMVVEAVWSEPVSGSFPC